MTSIHIGVALVALAAGMQAQTESGKAVFEKTCKQCHGPLGKGEPIADKFYQVTIPRLASDYIQRKSDDELRTIITQGIRKMPSVRVGQPTTDHKPKLTAPEVADVIAYVRTLKKTS